MALKTLNHIQNLQEELLQLTKANMERSPYKPLTKGHLTGGRNNYGRITSNILEVVQNTNIE